jgi:hypothetical protein
MLDWESPPAATRGRYRFVVPKPRGRRRSLGPRCSPLWPARRRNLVCCIHWRQTPSWPTALAQEVGMDSVTRSLSSLFRRCSRRNCCLARRRHICYHPDIRRCCRSTKAGQQAVVYIGHHSQCNLFRCCSCCIRCPARRHHRKSRSYTSMHLRSTSEASEAEQLAEAEQLTGAHIGCRSPHNLFPGCSRYTHSPALRRHSCCPLETGNCSRSTLFALVEAARMPRAAAS